MLQIITKVLSRRTAYNNTPGKGKLKTRNNYLNLHICIAIYTLAFQYARRPIKNQGLGIGLQKSPIKKGQGLE